MGDVGGGGGGGASGKGRKRKRVCWAEAELLEEVSVSDVVMSSCRHVHGFRSHAR